MIKLAKKKEAEQVEQSKPTKRNAHEPWKKSPTFTGNALANIEDGDNTKYITLNLTLASLPAIDLNDPEQVGDRLREYFEIHAQFDVKPTVSGMGLALGLDRRRLWEIKTGAATTHVKVNSMGAECKDLVKKSYELLETLWENYTQNGKMNPVAAIFLGKNHFGYKDQADHIITARQDEAGDYDASDIRQRYLHKSSTVELLEEPDDSVEG
jgi:hypothetical protein